MPSLMLLLSIIIASFSSHRYWAVEPAQVAKQSSYFWKNVSMMGGAVLLFITGAGRYALDAMLQRKPESSALRTRQVYNLMRAANVPSNHRIGHAKLSS